ncbi:MAG: T9SS type A sorting domain-containing protein [Salibacteraceae bacterium]|nr:T9SS type A sorting domain-containing protein [Salibacteraceae bacterium]
MIKSLKATLSIIMLTSSVIAQSGCTDPLADNYNASATVNDGSCTYQKTQQVYSPIGSISGYLGESSGLTFSDGFIWSHNDSGNPNKFFKINPQNGSVIQRLTVVNAANNDWEDITHDDEYIYIGDFGNNDGDRQNLKILKISKAQFINNSSVEVDVVAEEIRFSYADQSNFQSRKNHDFDCEALISVGDSLFIFTKNRANARTKVYHLPKDTGSYAVNPVEEYNVDGLITGAAYDSASGTIALIGYQQSHYNGFIWYLYDYQGTQFFSGNKRRVDIGNGTTDWQTEGIAYADSSKIFVSNENSYIVATLFSSNPLSDLQPLSISLEKTGQISIYPNPVSDVLHLECPSIIKTLTITDINSHCIFESEVNSKTLDIQWNKLSASSGIYFLTLQTETETLVQKIIAQ